MYLFKSQCVYELYESYITSISQWIKTMVSDLVVKFLMVKSSSTSGHRELRGHFLGYSHRYLLNFHPIYY